MKYTFKHFIVVDGEKKEVDPAKVSKISDQCKVVWTNITTGKEHTLVNS